MRTVTSFAEALAICLLGLMAGFFFAFSVDVAPAMTQLDGPGYVATQQAINAVVRNATFGGVYFGAALMPFVVAGLMWVGRRRRDAIVWAVIAVVYAAAVFVLTSSVNVPINNELATWNPAAPPTGWEQARDRWNESNLVRSIAAAACFASAVVLHGRFSRTTIAMRTGSTPASGSR